MSFKKYTMMAIKTGVGLVPRPVRNIAKKNPALTSFYSRSLQKSGLFYGIPSKKKLNALYTAALKRQARLIRMVLEQPVIHRECDVLILGSKDTSVNCTCQSLMKQAEGVGAVYVESENCIDNSNISTSLHLKPLASLLSFVTHNKPLLVLNAGDELHSQAMGVLIRQEFDGVLFVDTDEKLANGRIENARCLPDWNPDYQFSCGYIQSGLMVTTKDVANFLSTASQTIAGKLTECWLSNPALNVNHLTLALVHFKDSKMRQTQQLQEIAMCIGQLGAKATSLLKEQVNTVQWPVTQHPLVSLIIPTKNAKGLVQDCIESILNRSTYQNYEILLVDNNSDEPESLAYFDELNKHPKIRVLKYPHPFNYSAINNFAVKQAKGEVIGLVNNDIEVITPDWLEYMVGHALRADIGCVGAKLLYGDDRIQHAGVVLGYGGGAGHAHKYFPRYHPGYMNRLIASHNYSAVTAACLLIKKSLFDEVGGLNETDLTVAFNDVDFCLRVRALGVRNLYCAEAELYHHESVSRGLDVSKEKMARFNAELDYLQSNWAEVIKHDPAYNPNLTLRRENFSIKDQKEWNGLLVKPGN